MRLYAQDPCDAGGLNDDTQHSFALEASESLDQTTEHIEKTIREGSDLFQTLHRAKSSRIWQAEINSSYPRIGGERFFAFIRDINRRQRAEALLKVRLHLSEVATHSSLDDLLRAALDTANRMEYRLYEQIPDAQRIVIHTEPARHVD